MTGLKFTFNRLSAEREGDTDLSLGDYSHCVQPLNMEIYAEIKQDNDEEKKS